MTTSVAISATTVSLGGRLAIDYHVLSSLSATLDDVVARIGELSRTADDEDVGAIDLQEIERQLTTASRRLHKVTRRRS